MDWKNVRSFLFGLFAVVVSVAIIVVFVYVDGKMFSPPTLQDVCVAQEQRGGGDILVTECMTYNCSSLQVIDVRCVS